MGELFWVPQADPGDETDLYERERERERQEHLDEQLAERLWEHRPARPDPKPVKRVSRRRANSDAEARLAWKEAVFSRDQGCVQHLNPVDCADGWEAHHVLPQQLLRRDYPAELWNPLVGVCLCGRAHRRFHDGRILLLREVLPLEVWAHCVALSPAYMRKHYPSRDEVAA